MDDAYVTYSLGVLGLDTFLDDGRDLGGSFRHHLRLGPCLLGEDPGLGTLYVDIGRDLDLGVPQHDDCLCTLGHLILGLDRGLLVGERAATA